MKRGQNTRDPESGDGKSDGKRTEKEEHWEEGEVKSKKTDTD